MIISLYRRTQCGPGGKYPVLLLSAMMGILLATSTVFAQQAYTPLKQGEYEVKEESEFFNPGIIVNGSYRAYYSALKKDFVTGKDISDRYLQEIKLDIQSKVNTNLSLHAVIGNKSTIVSEQDEPFNNDYPDEEGDSTADGGMDLEFREAYLEYNHNPNAMLLIGKQFINIGDKIGLIYQGRANAISQQCRIGTWCYYVGGARIGNEGDSALFWAQIDYPVYESGVVVSDPWVEQGIRQEVSFNVELLRADYRGSDIPLSKSGMWVGDGSTHHATTVDGTTKYMYFENDGVQYMGFNLRWNFYDARLRFTWINLTGKRDYYQKEKGGSREFVSTRNIAGNAYYLDTDYKVAKNWKLGLNLFASTGTERDDGEDFWSKNSDNYLEIQKGDFGDALIYFNGKEGLGQGHSVSNLIYYSLRGSFVSDKEDLSFLIAFYSFQRNQAVFYDMEDGGPAKESTEIGSEVDFVLDWKLEEKLTAGLQLAYFSPGNAYSANDNIKPTENPDAFSLVGINLRYYF